jgi:hypothetical protein
MASGSASGRRAAQEDLGDRGASVVLCAAQNPFGASWASDNTILYGQGEQGAGGIWRVSGDGGKPEYLVKLEADQVA